MCLRAKMLIPDLPRRSWLARAAVAAGFLSLSCAVLVLSNGVVRNRSPLGDGVSGTGNTFLIVTRESLRPAFESLGEWIAEDGGSSVLFTVESLDEGTRGNDVLELKRICRRRGYQGLIIGGSESVLGASIVAKLERGPSRVLRAQVSTLDEAWRLVAAWRETGIPASDRPDVAQKVLPATGPVALGASQLPSVPAAPASR